MPLDVDAVRPTLEALAARFDATWRERDPVRFAHRYADPADREAAALLAATFAFGGVKAILGSLERLFERLGPRPAATLDGLAGARAARALTRGFRHRWLGEIETAAILRAVRALRASHGSLEAAFAAGDDPRASDVEPGLAAFSERLRAAAGAAPAPGRALKFAFPTPGGGSACKRLNLFLRWCARPADGVDLGLWTRVDRARLVVPLDVHLAFHARVLGFTRRPAADWRAALETTAALRRFDAVDPVRFDFALCHLGIHGDCRGRRDDKVCPACPLDAVCRLPRARPRRPRRSAAVP
ncbi:MAG TPA: TIGR02757 family protein [Planctomycetota bacterium]|nr:TIGR02757 family protein [Planctomycetota bacterium]